MEFKMINANLSASSSTGCSSSGCGSSQNQLAHLPEQIRQKVQDHPCYSEQAHHHFARMHVAVAPACNIQCHYCNRKYDCSNESRPGVVSELLTPEQAVHKVLVVGDKIPQMTVVGIAGPGDSLANPERTFRTFKMLNEQAAGMKLCLSTNGLALPENVDEIVKHHIDHVTITINCVDPDIGEKIYPWIFWNHQRVKGREGVKILIEQQQKGLEMLVERGVLVKVNSVMIPGVNDEHLKEVNRVIHSKGAFLHNIMPLISEPEHGTFYGLTGQREPSSTELQTVQDACSGNMNVMRHCRQCRADAVGLLGEDRGEEFSLAAIETIRNPGVNFAKHRVGIRQTIQHQLKRRTQPRRNDQQPDLPDHIRPVLMAVASQGGGLVNQHFGHAREFLVYEVSPKGVRFMGHRRAALYCDGGDHCGETEATLDRIIASLQGCEAVLCSKIGYEPWDRLEQAGIQPNGEHGMEDIETAVYDVYSEMWSHGLLETRANQRDTA